MRMRSRKQIAVLCLACAVAAGVAVFLYAHERSKPPDWSPSNEAVALLLEQGKPAVAAGPGAQTDGKPGAQAGGKPGAAGAGAQVGGSGGAAGKPVAPTAPPQPSNSGTPAAVNVNTATASQLEKLPGIGPSKAKAIVEHRAKHGPFSQPEDLLRVHGIGPKLLERMLPAVTVGP